MAVSSSRDRVPDHTSNDINLRIESVTKARIAQFADRPEAIASRLAALDREWDIERAIEANAATLAFVGVVLGYFAHPYWLLLPALVTAFLFQHAIQGWCPPVPILRRLGFRTVYEIEQERHALKLLRGDYNSLDLSRDKAAAALQAAKS